MKIGDKVKIIETAVIGEIVKVEDSVCHVEFINDANNFIRSKFEHAEVEIVEAIDEAEKAVEDAFTSGGAAASAPSPSPLPAASTVGSGEVGNGASGISLTDNGETTAKNAVEGETGNASTTAETSGATGEGETGLGESTTTSVTPTSAPTGEEVSGSTESGEGSPDSAPESQA